jgi:hypothetical protein
MTTERFSVDGSFIGPSFLAPPQPVNLGAHTAANG